MNEATFVLSVIGDVTCEKWYGNFKCKTRLSHRDYLEVDKVKRELLGPNPQNASPRADSSAEILAQLAVRIVDSPSWWKNSGGGLELEDDNVIVSVFEQALAAEKTGRDELKKRAEEAKKDLKTAGSDT